MCEKVKDLYMDILKTNIKNAEKIVELSWRYHATYIKVIETIIDSQNDHNKE
jgi:hypothetical protein